MKNAKQTVIVFDEIVDRDDSFQKLSQMGFHQLHSIDTRDQLHVAIENDSDQLLLVSFPDLPLPLVVANIRSVLGVGGLIVIKGSDSNLTVSELLIAGADVVVDATGYDCTEILAWHTALRRRVEALVRHIDVKHPTASDSSLQSGGLAETTSQSVTWYLVDGGWALLSPDNKRISLTYGEKFFLASFVGEPDKRVSREQLLGLNAIQNQGSRAVDSLVSRLRKKAVGSGFSLPVKSVHGWGYSFMGLLDYFNERACPFKKSDQEAGPSYTELINAQEINQQLESGRFFFNYDLIVHTTSGVYYGAVAHLYWKSSTGEQLLVESFADHLDALQVWPVICRWALVNLRQELVEWDQKYDFDLPIILAWSAKRLPQIDSMKQEQVLQINNKKQLGLLIHGLHEFLDHTMLKAAFECLQKADVTIWLRFEDTMSQHSMRLLESVSGVSIMLDASLVLTGEKHVEHAPFVAHTRRLGLPLLCEAVDSLPQKEFSLAIGAKYATGSAVALPLCKDGLLLAWASQENAI